MTRIDLVRDVVADPAGVALLLSGPVGRDLWPDRGVRFGAPQRSGLGFLAAVTVGVPASARGRLTINVAERGPGAARLRLVLQADERGGAVARAADDFLDRLADAAHARSSAA